jgi:AraC-like DNA-binding protein
MRSIGLTPVKVSLGVVELEQALLSDQKMAALDKELKSIGLERIEDKKTGLIESTKNEIIRIVHHDSAIDHKYNWSSILADRLGYDYSYLSQLFSSIEGTTLEQYIIRQKIERAKELIFNGNLSLAEMADHLGYSSAAHLSAQFKKITGVTPSEFRKSGAAPDQKVSLDQI